jgi:hypothetical protein
VIRFITEDPALVSEWDDVRRLTEALNAHGPRPFSVTGEVNHEDLVRWEAELEELIGALQIRVEELRVKTVDKVKDAPVVSFQGEIESTC